MILTPIQSVAMPQTQTGAHCIFTVQPTIGNLIVVALSYGPVTGLPTVSDNAGNLFVACPLALPNTYSGIVLFVATINAVVNNYAITAIQAAQTQENIVGSATEFTLNQALPNQPGILTQILAALNKLVVVEHA